GLTLADGTVVTFDLNGTAIGTGTVTSGNVHIFLSSKNGDTVPAIIAGDILTVVEADGTTVDLTGTFGLGSNGDGNGGDGDGNGHGSGGNGGGSVTASESGLKAKLTGTGTQTAAIGVAEFGTVTLTNKTTGTSTTNSSLGISVGGLTLADSSVVTFNLNGTAIGTGTVTSGNVHILLSSKNGDTVPAVSAADILTVVDPGGTTVDLSGTFGSGTGGDGNGGNGNGGNGDAGNGDGHGTGGNGDGNGSVTASEAELKRS
ncbi:MAG: hypothetical protein JWM11_6499, partial [Planctomycetaceae bacterium]|nr:hypothetical protein [Planctomycetaceae bacterium]